MGAWAVSKIVSDDFVSQRAQDTLFTKAGRNSW